MRAPRMPCWPREVVSVAGVHANTGQSWIGGFLRHLWHRMRTQENLYVFSNTQSCRSVVRKQE